MYVRLNVKYTSCQHVMQLEFSHRFSKNMQISTFMKIHPVGAGFHADGRTDRYDEEKSLFAVLRTRRTTANVFWPDFGLLCRYVGVVFVSTLCVFVLRSQRCQFVCREQIKRYASHFGCVLRNWLLLGKGLVNVSSRGRKTRSP